MDMVIAVSRVITLCVALMVNYWILQVSMFSFRTRLLLVAVVAGMVHSRLLWDYERYQLYPDTFRAVQD
jgi:hypothetical protein